MVQIRYDKNDTGRENFEVRRRSEREHPIEITGASLRSTLPFVEPINVDGEA